MATAELENCELMLSPNATESTPKQNRSAKAASTSVALTPPNRKGRAPTGTSITM